MNLPYSIADDDLEIFFDDLEELVQYLRKIRGKDHDIYVWRSCSEMTLKDLEEFGRVVYDPTRMCPGCMNNQPNQEAHIGSKGCLGY